MEAGEKLHTARTAFSFFNQIWKTAKCRTNFLKCTIAGTHDNVANPV
jgi:hypothetical protein